MNPGPSAYRAHALPTELRCQLVQPEFNPDSSSNHSAAILLSYGHFERHISFFLAVFFLWMSTVDSIYLVYYFIGYLYAVIGINVVVFIANPSRNRTFQRFAMVAEKEKTQRNK